MMMAPNAIRLSYQYLALEENYKLNQKFHYELVIRGEKNKIVSHSINDTFTRAVRYWSIHTQIGSFAEWCEYEEEGSIDLTQTVTDSGYSVACLNEIEQTDGKY